MKIENKKDTDYKGSLIFCTNCNKKIGKIDKNRLHILTYKDGNRSEIIIEINHDKGGSFKIESSCCGSSFGRSKKAMPLVYELKKQKKQK